ncbi:MAG: hypothetical protein MJ230_06485 [bacterium]|nr:hypothetical protein [bacterium]
MNIQSISAQDSCCPKTSFKGMYVTLSEKNLGKNISREVVDTFNAKILPKIRMTQAAEADEVILKAGGAGKVIANSEDFKSKVDFFALAAGSGSRFAKLAQTVGNYNKISLPFKLNKTDDIHMLDFAMAMGKHFIGDEGVKTIVAPFATGSFGDIVENFRHNPVKDIVVCCGDNVFADKATDMMPFFTRLMNNPNKHVGLVGVKRTPEVVAERFGVLGVEIDKESGIAKLTGFEEKPPVEVARKMAVDGYNFANTGMFTLSKDVMAKIMDEINNGVNNIYKRGGDGLPKYKVDENGNKVLAEPYDFAEAVKYAHKMLPEWFGIESKEGSEVLIVDKWEDVGEPEALYAFANDIKQYSGNFPKEVKENINNAFEKRVHVKDETPYINFTDAENVSSEQINNAPLIEGVHIVV